MAGELLRWERYVARRPFMLPTLGLDVLAHLRGLAPWLAPVGVSRAAASRLDNDEAGSGGVGEARDVVPVSGHDLGLLGDRHGDDRRVHNISGARPAEEPPHGVSRRLIEGEDRSEERRVGKECRL